MRWLGAWTTCFMNSFIVLCSRPLSPRDHHDKTSAWKKGLCTLMMLPMSGCTVWKHQHDLLKWWKVEISTLGCQGRRRRADTKAVSTTSLLAASECRLGNGCRDGQLPSASPSTDQNYILCRSCWESVTCLLCQPLLSECCHVRVDVMMWVGEGVLLLSLAVGYCRCKYKCLSADSSEPWKVLSFRSWVGFDWMDMCKAQIMAMGTESVAL